MVKAPALLESSVTSQAVYIPHHPVVRESSTTTRVRVVFNASSITTNGTSLNTHLLAGAKLQTEIFDVILRWRQYRYVYTADMAKMFRQIWVDPRDQDYQRILWYSDNSTDIQEYKLCTVTYGTVSAPYLSLRVLRQLVTDEGEKFPLAVPVFKNHIYVDDVIFGADDIQLLRLTREQVCGLLQRGGFKLRKWASNCTELLTDIPSDDHGLATTKNFQLKEGLTVLGILWNPSLDVFQFQVSLPKTLPCSKRTILSTITKIFDPLGWAIPITTAAKVFMQQLWRLKLDWDETIPDKALLQWEVIYKKLNSLDGIQFPRWTRCGSDILSCELHGFADASTVAYASVVYLKVVSNSGETNIILLAGKSKVAPIKPTSVPRLELLAVFLLSRLLDSVRSSLNLENVACHCWTDSAVALAWLSQHPSRWKTFVSHRVEAIQSRVPYAKWHHVPTDENPADCASRGHVPMEFSTFALWWHGPTWLQKEPSEWPNVPFPSAPEIQSEERKVEVGIHVVQVKERWNLASRYSSWFKLVRVTAYMIRFLNRCRGKTRSSADDLLDPNSLSVEECQQARSFWFRIIQEEVFPEELKRLR